MNVTRNDILKMLPVFAGEYELLSDDQTVEDIMRGIKRCHKEYAQQYDTIAQYFVGNSTLETCRNIFDFLRANSFYYIEDEMNQTVRSPQAIVATGSVEGIDCKNYALFCGGVLDAINRSDVQDIPFVYRFVSDRLLDTSPNHVFIVAFPETNKEVWVDPIPPVKYFNQKISYYYHTDKNYRAMPLFKISGLNQAVQDLDFIVIDRDNRSLGDIQNDIESVVPFGGTAMAIFNFVSHPDNSQNWVWNAAKQDWPYWIERDITNNNPAHNFIAFLQRNPTALKDQPWDTSQGSGVPMPLSQRISKAQARMNQAGMGTQFNQFLSQYGYTGGLLSTPGVPVTNTLFTTKNMVIGAVVVFVAGKWIFKWW